MSNSPPDSTLLDDLASLARTLAVGLAVGLLCLPLVVAGQVFRHSGDSYTFGSPFSLAASTLFGILWIVLFSRSGRKGTPPARAWRIGLLTGAFLALFDLTLDLALNVIARGELTSPIHGLSTAIYLIAATVGLRGGLHGLQMVEKGWTLETIRILARTASAAACVWVLSTWVFLLALRDGGHQYEDLGRNYVAATQMLINLVFAGFCAYPRRETPFLYGLRELGLLRGGESEAPRSIGAESPRGGRDR